MEIFLFKPFIFTPLLLFPSHVHIGTPCHCLGSRAHNGRQKSRANSGRAHSDGTPPFPVGIHSRPRKFRLCLRNRASNGIRSLKKEIKKWQIFTSNSCCTFLLNSISPLLPLSPYLCHVPHSRIGWPTDRSCAVPRCIRPHLNERWGIGVNFW